MDVPEYVLILAGEGDRGCLGLGDTLPNGFATVISSLNPDILVRSDVLCSGAW